MTINPQIVIAALKRGQAGFVHETVPDAANAVRVIIDSNPDAFVVGRIGPRQSASQATKALRRLLMRELLVETMASRKTTHRNRFELLQIRQGLLSAEVTKAENNHVVWIRAGFNVKHVDALLDQMVGREVRHVDAVSPVREASTVSPGMARQQRLLQQEQWVDSLQVHQLLNGKVTTNASQMAARLRNHRKLIGVQVGGVYLHPRVQIDESTGVVLPVMSKLLEIFPETASRWELVMWLFQRRHDLDGKRPADLLKMAPDRVLKAAQDDVAPGPESG